MNTKQICARFGMSVRTLSRRRSEGLPGSQPVIGGAWEYDPVAVERWLQKRYTAPGYKPKSGKAIIAALRAAGGRPPNVK